MKYTGIPINFGIAVALGFLVGTAIAGQTFYNFTLDNLRHFGASRRWAHGNGLLLRMILLQALMVGCHRLWPGRRRCHARWAGSCETPSSRSACPRRSWVQLRVAVMPICIISAAHQHPESDRTGTGNRVQGLSVTESGTGCQP